ncbi:MAG: HAMP domain-containing sensor histidine kinase [Gaiellales bacterium]
MRVRLLLTMLALTGVLLTVLVIPLGIASARSERRDLEAKVERDATAVASLAEDTLEAKAPAPPALHTLAKRYRKDTGGRIVVVGVAGVSIVDSEGKSGRSFASRPEVGRALAGEVASGRRRSATLSSAIIFVAVPVASGGVVRGAVRITYPTTTADARVHRAWMLLGVVSILALLVAASLAVWLARWASRPLVGLETAAAAVAAGNRAARAPLTGPPEVRSAAAAFNEMVERLESLVTSQSEFVADASHQLRTPLTALRLRLDNLELAASDEMRDGLEAAVAEAGRLTEIMDGLLALARADGGATPATAVDLTEVATDRAEAWEALAAERGIEVVVEPASQVSVRVARDRVDQVLDNLIANAIEASPDGDTVRLLVSTVGDRGELRVRDGGPGLVDDDKRRALDRFWRASRTPGSGLGLPIAKRLVEIDHGMLELLDAPGGGLDAVVRLPLARPERLDPGAARP